MDMSYYEHLKLSVANICKTIMALLTIQCVAHRESLQMKVLRVFVIIPFG